MPLILIRITEAASDWVNTRQGKGVVGMRTRIQTSKISADRICVASEAAGYLGRSYLRPSHSTCQTRR